jgi:hypothetical protein
MAENHLSNGTYVKSADKVVTYWPAADKDGDGDIVWVNMTDVMGNSVGRQIAKDKDGNELRNYLPPEGFVNFPSFDHTDNYVKTDYRGAVYRNPATGEAVGIQPGQAVVEHADGTTEILADEYARYVFAQSHERVDDLPPVPDDNEPKKATPAKAAAK